MARPRKSASSYLLHSATGQARAVWTDVDSVGHRKLLPGPSDSEESDAPFGRLRLRVKTAPGPVSSATGVEPLIPRPAKGGWRGR